jgi:hypothetical protein
MAGQIIEIVNGFGRPGLILWQLEPWIEDYERERIFPRVMKLRSRSNEFGIYLYKSITTDGLPSAEIHGKTLRTTLDVAGGIVIAGTRFNGQYDPSKRKGLLTTT